MFQEATEGSASGIEEDTQIVWVRTLRTSALDEVRSGVTTIDEIMRVVDLKSD